MSTALAERRRLKVVCPHDCPDTCVMTVDVEDGDAVEVDLDASVVRVRGTTLAFPPLPPLIEEIVVAGGLVEYGRRLLSAGASQG